MSIKCCKSKYFGESKELKSQQHKTIIVIDDDPACLIAMKLMLCSTNHKVIKAESAEVGLGLLLNNNVDLILLDIDMPGMSGLELLSIIKSKSNLKHIPVILQSAAELSVLQQGIALGANKFLRKPCARADVLEAVNSIFSKGKNIKPSTTIEEEIHMAKFGGTLPAAFNTIFN